MISSISQYYNGFGTAESRWSRFGPYYAMFPVEFAFNVINKYSDKNDYILDPFAGRCSSIFAGGVLGRNSHGIEINPIGWLYGSSKLKPAPKDEIKTKLNDIYNKRNYYERSIKKLPKFYRICFCDEVLKFLLSAKANLNWKEKSVDSTLMSILLVYLHGKIGEGLSNQMRMTKAMGMNYSVEWWKKNKMINPPEINPLDFILKKIEWRYEKGLPNITSSKVYYGDSTFKLNSLIQKSKERNFKYSLLFTSPPYYSITNYHSDQWLRLWLLGYEPEQSKSSLKYKGRFISKLNYTNLLNKVFYKSSLIMSKQSTIYVRTDARKYTFETTKDILKNHFPKHYLKSIKRPFKNKTQTQLFGDFEDKPGEIDLILTK